MYEKIGGGVGSGADLCRDAAVQVLSNSICDCMCMCGVYFFRSVMRFLNCAGCKLYFISNGGGETNTIFLKMAGVRVASFLLNSRFFFRVH